MSLHRSERHMALDAAHPSDSVRISARKETYGGCVCSLGKPACDCVPAVEELDEPEPVPFRASDLGWVTAFLLALALVFAASPAALPIIKSMLGVV